MSIPELLQRARRYPVLTIGECHQWFPELSRASLTVALTRAVQNGYLLRVKRGVFVLNEEPFPDRDAIAMKLDPRAAISMETVLARTGMIPESVFALTAVTPAGTARYETDRFGTFLFRHEKASLDFGWELKRHGAYSVRVARPEKALMDLLWFHRFERDGDAYARELRLHIPEQFSWARFRRSVRLAKSDAFTRLAHAIEHRYR